MLKRAWLLSLSLTLWGCASWRHEPEQAQTEAARPEPTQVDVNAPRPLKALLVRNLDIARLASIAKGQPVPASEMARLKAGVPSQARMLLATEGYFSPQVEVNPSGTPDTVEVNVQPGPRTVVSTVELHLQGELAEAAGRGDPRAMKARLSLMHDWALPAGQPFRNEDWRDAKVAWLSDIWSRGYRRAALLDSGSDIDVDAQRAALHVSADSGPLFLTGPLRIQGLVHHDEKTVRNLANFPPGTPATDRLLLDYQERLQSAGLFNRATVSVSRDAVDPASAPVTVTLTERKLQELTLGAGVSSDVGARGTVEHVHRRAFGKALTARNKFELSGVHQAWDGELRTHALEGLYQNLIGITTERTDTVGSVETSARVRVGRSLDTPRLDKLVFIEAERSLVREGPYREQTDALSAHVHRIWRRLDNVRLPTRGYALAVQAGGGQARSDPGSSGPFARVYGRVQGYRPLGGQWHLQGRLELGQVFSGDDVTAPASMRFRAGGQDSVRGYGYRSLAPTVDGLVTGGKTLMTTSVELAHPLLERFPDLWGAVFVDAGRAANRWRDLRPAVGIGAGVRYRSPVGPVSVDLAWGQEVRKARLHVSVGVTF